LNHDIEKTLLQVVSRDIVSSPGTFITPITPSIVIHLITIMYDSHNRVNPSTGRAAMFPRLAPGPKLAPEGDSDHATWPASLMKLHSGRFGLLEESLSGLGVGR
jgi:hypothetical protein